MLPTFKIYFEFNGTTFFNVTIVLVSDNIGIKKRVCYVLAYLQSITKITYEVEDHGLLPLDLQHS